MKLYFDTGLAKIFKIFLCVCMQRVSASSRKRNLIMKLYVDTGLAKIEGAGEYVGDLLECGAKFLVFAHHQQVSL